MNQKRRSPRSNLLMAATLEHWDGFAAVTLRNLSASGAMVEGDHGLAKDSEVIFRKGELAVQGRIAWVEGRRAGIAFDASLDPEAVLRHVPPPSPMRDEVHKRPGFRGRLSAADRRFGEAYFGRPFREG